MWCRRSKLACAKLLMNDAKVVPSVCFILTLIAFGDLELCFPGVETRRHGCCGGAAGECVAERIQGRSLGWQGGAS